MATYPIRRLEVESFGPFRTLNVEVGPQLTVVVGENAAGKSQFLKLLYSTTKELAVDGADVPTKKNLNGAIADKLLGVFRPDSLGRLVRRRQGQTRAKVKVDYDGIDQALMFSFSSHAKKEVLTESVPGAPLADQPVFLPPQELLSLPHTFVSMFNAYDTGFEETWRDTAELLWRPALRGPRERRASDLIVPILDRLHGSVVDFDGRFYLNQKGVGTLESTLLAEGQRKLAMIARLVANGVLLEGGYLFWDEPEANLNPNLLKTVARLLFELAKNGVQVVVSTHSMFLMRELQMNGDDFPDVKPTYVGFARDGETWDAEVVAEVEDDFDALSCVAALEAEAEHANRFLVW